MIKIDNGSGKLLSARLDAPPGETPKAWAIFAHCFTCSKNLKAVGHISRALVDRGFGVLRFDFTGLGESEGSFSETSFSSNISDIVAAADYLRDSHGSPSILIGHSLGGAAVLHAAAKLESVTAVATIGAPFDPAHVSHLFGGALDEIESSGSVEVSIGGRPFTLTNQFVKDLHRHDPAAMVRELGKALLVLHSPIDVVVGIENAALIYEAARHPKSFVSLDTADHLMTNEDDSRYAGEIIGAWAQRYIQKSSETDTAMGNTRSVFVSIGRDDYPTTISTPGHLLRADEPVHVGGQDSGPTPYDLLLGSLGACTAITVRMYANRKEWDLESVHVELSHERVHADDCDCETDRLGLLDVIERKISFVGSLDTGQRKRLAEIANKCPVHRTIESTAVIKTRIADPAVDG